jgi:Leucine-rich repeat (LRR) protein
MKKLFYILILITGMTNAQIVNIPDANFKAALLSANIPNRIALNAANMPIVIDINNDGEIQQSEASSVVGLYVFNAGFSDLTGIQGFTNLKYLYCGGNSIVNLTALSNMLTLEQLGVSANPNIDLNVSGLTNLKIFQCDSCNLTSLDASIFPNLEELVCSANNLSNNLNLSGLVNLKSLRCEMKGMSAINNLSELTNLEFLNCQSNIFSSLDVSNLVNLKGLYCQENAIANLNISGCTNLENINVSSNNLTNLNVSNLIHLDDFNCSSNNISALNFSGSNAITKFNCYQNQVPGLDFTSLLNLTDINCSFNQLTFLNVQGLNQVVNLYCNNNLLTSLNLNGLQNLQRMSANTNELTSLQLDGLPALKFLWCDNNNLTALNLPASNILIDLECSDNALTALNIGLYPNLYQLACGNNLLTNLDFSNSSALQYVSIGGNQLTTLDVSNLAGLLYLTCANNQFTTIDVSQNHSLQTFYAYDNELLETIYMKNGSDESSFFLSTTNWTPANLPNLRFICADESQVSAVQTHLNGISLPNTVVNSYCSFNPGGDHNTINGTVTFDGNNNGCDNNDIFQPNIRVNINDGTNQGATFTNTTGNYNFYTQSGSFDLTPNIENPTWFTFSPTTATIPFADNNNNTATQNFCISANGIHPDVEIVIAPITPARPGFDATYKIVYKNKGNQTLSGNVSFSYDDAVLDFVSATVVPNSQSLGALSWNYTNLLPFESRSFEIVLNVNAPTETPAVNIGDILNFSASVNPIAGDEIPSDNTYTYAQTVVGSYDPNDIICLEGDIVAPSEIGNYLHYNIRFENTGTAPAEFVVVKVEVNQTDFDMNSLQIMNSSDPVDARINQNIVEFIFQNIQLESGGHGNILLKIKSKNNLLVGDEVNKKANIYFDYNFPILTNDAETVFQSLNNPDFQNDASISVYPNPTNGIVTVNCNNSIKSIQLYDVQGRLLQTNLVNENETTIDVSTKSKGVYFLKILSDKGMKVEKIVRE